MSNNILIPILETVKLKDGSPAYCCMKQWLMIHRNVRTGELADAWGMSPSTIRYWRRKMKLGEVQCELLPRCKIYGEKATPK